MSSQWYSQWTLEHEYMRREWWNDSTNGIGLSKVWISCLRTSIYSVMKVDDCLGIGSIKLNANLANYAFPDHYESIQRSYGLIKEIQISNVLI